MGNKLCLIIGALFLAIFVMRTTVSAQTLPGLSKAEPAAPEQTATQIAPLTPAQIDTLLSGLTDAQARQLLRAQLESLGDKGTVSPGQNDVTGFLSILNEKPGQIIEAFERWVELTIDAPARFARGVDTVTGGRGVGFFSILLLTIIGLIVIGQIVDWSIGRMINKLRARLRDEPAETPAVKCGRMIAVTLLDLFSLAIFAGVVFVLFHLFIPKTPNVPTQLLALTIVSAVVIIRVVGIFSRFFLAPLMPNLRISYLTDDAAISTHKWISQMMWVIGAAVAIQGVITVMGIADPQFRAMIASYLGTILVTVVVAGIWRHREAVRYWLRGDERCGDDWEPSLLRVQFADIWHILATVYVVVVFAWWLVNALTGAPVPFPAVLLSLIIIPAVPILDSASKHVIEALVLVREKREIRSNMVIGPEVDVDDDDTAAATEPPTSETADEHDKISGYHPLAFVGHRIFRVALVIGAVLLMLKAWGFDALSGMESQMDASTFRVVMEFIVAIGIGYVVWEFINAFTLPHMPKAGPNIDMEEGGGNTRNRLETLMPLLRASLLTALVIMVAMISLSAFGVNIGPLLAGAGVVGIAIGFGAQKLVADVIAGVFFLIDDAFRVGEYVDTGSVKGTVEKISIRSLQLRHHRGALHTIPFGEIRHLTNYHRDWAIVKMEFRVPYETDVEKVRKIIKKEGQEMLEDERFAQTMLAPLKSQGVARMEDSAMIIRAKFTAVPGEQFVMRREAYRRIQQALQANGIEFAHRKVTVEFPDRGEIEIELDDDEKRAIGAAAEAATSAEQAPAVADSR